MHALPTRLSILEGLDLDNDRYIGPINLAFSDTESSEDGNEGQPAALAAQV
jgi:hypothetical protein